MALGICRLCRRNVDLCESHIIPNSYFKRIKRGNDGKLISFDDSTDGLVDQSITSWSESMLCRPCEQKFSVAESYSIQLMEDADRTTPKREEGALIQQFDYAAVRLFTQSILWRAAESALPEFAKVNLPGSYRDSVRQHLHSGQPLSPRELACKFARLYDQTPADRGGMGAHHLRTLIASPFTRVAGRHATTLFLLGGYILEIFVPTIPNREWQKLGVLKDESKLFIPPVSIFGVPELRKLLFAGHVKQRLQQYTPAMKRRDAKGS